MPQIETVRQDGAAIRRLRIRQGLTSEQLGRLIGRRGSIRHVELGTRKVSAIFLNQIANALGVDPSEITKDDDAEGEQVA